MVLSAFFVHAPSLKLNQQLLNVLLTLLLGLTMPWVQLLPQSLVFGVLQLFLLDLILSCCLVITVHILIEMEVEELLLNTLLQLAPLLHSQPPEANLVLQCIDAHL